MDNQRIAQLLAQTYEYIDLLDGNVALCGEKYNKLVEILVFHREQYYKLDDPKISDYDYDRLFNLLLVYEENNVANINSPTQVVGFI